MNNSEATNAAQLKYRHTTKPCRSTTHACYLMCVLLYTEPAQHTNYIFAALQANTCTPAQNRKRPSIGHMFNSYVHHSQIWPTVTITYLLCVRLIGISVWLIIFQHMLKTPGILDQVWAYLHWLLYKLIVCEIVHLRIRSARRPRNDNCQTCTAYNGGWSHELPSLWWKEPFACCKQKKTILKGKESTALILCRDLIQVRGLKPHQAKSWLRNRRGPVRAKGGVSPEYIVQESFCSCNGHTGAWEPNLRSMCLQWNPQLAQKTMSWKDAEE